MSQNAIITYVYPEALSYLEAFCKTLDNQDYQDFAVIIFNDGVDGEVLKKSLPDKYKVINISGTIVEVRVRSLNILKELFYKKYLFADIDDTMTANRARLIFTRLNDFDLVCNDLNLMTDSEEVFSQNIWMSRLDSNFKFDFEFIKRKNIVGFGNTGINKKLLLSDFKYDPNPIVADWFIFYQLMEKSRCNALFVSECQTNYRQHAHNDAGIKAITKERLIHVCDVIQKHHKGLNAIGYSFAEDHCLNINELNLKDNYNVTPFWWEEIEIAYEKN